MTAIAPRRMEQSIFNTIVEMAYEMKNAQEAEKISHYFTEMICDGYWNNKKEDEEGYVSTKGKVNQCIRYNGLTLNVERFWFLHFENTNKIRLFVDMYVIHDGYKYNHFNAKDKKCFSPIGFFKDAKYGEEEDTPEAISVLETDLHNHLLSILRHNYSQQKAHGLRM